MSQPQVSGQPAISQLSAQPKEAGLHQQSASWRDYYQLTKPKVVMLMLLTALVGMCLAAPGWPGLSPVLFGLLGIALLAGAAAAFNHILDQRIDAQMVRTKQRPMVKGLIRTPQAVGFALLLAAVGMLMLGLLVNWLTACLTLASLLGYAVIYTGFLKRATPQNIVIGGVAGAMPPLLGWTAVTGSLHPHALLLVMIIFTWTPPHFWALAIHRRDDYAKAGIPMLPVTHGIEFTKSAVLLYTLLLFAVGWLPLLTGMSGWLYGVGAALLNLAFIYYAWQLKFNSESAWAMKTFRFSIIHLLLTFVVLLVDHYG